MMLVCVFLMRCDYGDDMLAPTACAKKKSLIPVSWESLAVKLMAQRNLKNKAPSVRALTLLSFKRAAK